MEETVIRLRERQQETLENISKVIICLGILAGRLSVADPDPPDPRVFGPSGSGFGSISQRYGSGSGSGYGSGFLSLSTNSKENLDFYCFVTSF